MRPNELKLAGSDVVERLETLDDTIFNALNGDAEALANAAKCWDEVVAVLGIDLIEDSREQYLRYANDIWQESREAGRVGPEQATHILDIILLLTA